MKNLTLSILVFVSVFNTMISQNLSDTETIRIYKLRDSAHILNNQNKFSESLTIGNQILEYSLKTGNDTILAQAYNLLGNTYSDLENEDKAIEYLMKYKEISKKIKDKIGVGMAYNNIGVHYRDVGNKKASYEAFKKALNIAESSKEIIYPAFNIGIHLLENEKDYLAAKMYFEKSLKATESQPSVGKHRIIGDIYESLCITYYKLGEYDISEKYYKKCLVFSEKYGYLEVLSYLFDEKAKAFAENKKFEEANKMLELYIENLDSIKKVEKFKTVKQIEADYFIKENKDKLKFVEAKNKIQADGLKKSRLYNFFLGLLSVILVISGFHVYKKNKQLKKARDRAENLTKVKSKFYSEISHELRTPLYAVIELSSLLLRENLNVKHKEYLESLKFSGNHLLSLINNVLELNKVESGKTKLQMMDFDLKNLITNIIDSLEYALRDSDNSINLQYDNTIPKALVGDSLKLSQILINLISNAIKFTSNGHINLIVNRVKTINDGVILFFKVSDNGVGISVENQKQIFEDFYQENTKNDKTYKGTGLGLSIVKRTLNAMGSDINVESRENEGATFSFNLTFKLSNKLSNVNFVYETQLTKIKNKRILIVDDNKINQLVTTKVLDQLGIKSKAVDSGKNAIVALKGGVFDCILMDLHMPELDGYETSVLIREFNKTIPIIALTAASTEEVETKIKDYQMNGYVFKPFFNTDLVESLSDAIS